MKNLIEQITFQKLRIFFILDSSVMERVFF